MLSVGLDLAPALDSNGEDSGRVIEAISAACQQRRGEGSIPESARHAIRRVAKVLNVAWIEDALAINARIICPRSTRCPRTEPCERAMHSRARDLVDVRKEIIGAGRGGRSK